MRNESTLGLEVLTSATCAGSGTWKEQRDYARFLCLPELHSDRSPSFLQSLRHLFFACGLSVSDLYGCIIQVSSQLRLARGGTEDQKTLGERNWGSLPSPCLGV